uniref:Uncharacterized protein n=1 Tax=Cacopsylla melanoneura TaxID=428564 RepID=A0A8D8LNJ9_9HEMI
MSHTSWFNHSFEATRHAPMLSTGQGLNILIHHIISVYSHHVDNTGIQNNLEAYVYQVKQALDDSGSKLSEAEKTSCREECDARLQWLDNDLLVTVGQDCNTKVWEITPF